MQQQISLREANQHLSHYIDEVEEGAEIIITRRGRPVARLLPIIQKPELTETQQKIWKRLINQFRKGHSLGKQKFDREQVHER